MDQTIQIDGQYTRVKIPGKGHVVIKNEEEGLVVDIYPLDESVEDPVASTWVHDNELQDEPKNAKNECPKCCARIDWGEDVCPACGSFVTI